MGRKISPESFGRLDFSWRYYLDNPKIYRWRQIVLFALMLLPLMVWAGCSFCVNFEYALILPFSWCRPHLLFYGPPGTGKTSTIKAVAQQMYGKAYRSMTLELNASDSRGIDVVRDTIKTFAGTKSVFTYGVKLVILDEADAMTSDAQAALRRVMEKYSKNTRFCMICNYVSKIIPALQSRCTRFRFAPLSEEQMQIQIKRVVTNEGLTLTEDGKMYSLELLQWAIFMCSSYFISRSFRWTVP